VLNRFYKKSLKSVSTRLACKGMKLFKTAPICNGLASVGAVFIQSIRNEVKKDE